MPSEKRPYNERLIEQVKALGQDVIDRAEDLVGRVYLKIASFYQTNRRGKCIPHIF